MLDRVRPILGPGVMTFAILCMPGLPVHAQEKPPPKVGAAASETERPTPAPVSTMTHEQQLEARTKELEKRLEALSSQVESDSLERMTQDAQNEARAAQEQPKPEEREFLEGSLALQKLNPEITLSADIMAGLVIDRKGRFYAGESDRSGIPLRAVGLHVQHVLDPYSTLKSAFHIAPAGGFHVEEVYVSWFGLVPSLSFTVGRFRQNFGILNRWHEHDLDQTQYPLALESVLGEEGLVGDGLMVKWLMPPLWAHANELTLEVVDGTNETLFAGEHFSIPSSLCHLKNYYDLSDSTYLELGITGMFGFNNKRGYPAEQQKLADEPWRRTVAAGADLTLYWSPPQQARYRSLTWRTEFYYVNKELVARTAPDLEHSWGLYSYLQYQLSARWFVGVRGDVALPTVRNDNEALTWDVVPYVTLWQSEFVYLRLEYRHGQNMPYEKPDDSLGRRMDNRVLFQIDFAAGPHKHEKY